MTYEELDIPSHLDGWVRDFAPMDSGRALRLHSHRELELNLVTQGTGAYLIQGGRYALSPGTLLWLFPDQPHVLVETAPKFRMWVAVFRPRLIQRLTASTPGLDVLRLKDPGAVFVQTLRQEVFPVLNDLFHHLAAVPASDDEYFNAGLGYLFRRSWEEGQAASAIAATARIHPAVERSIHLMNTGRLTGSLEQLAKHAGLSYSRLCDLFQSQMGETLSAYRNRLRVERFRYLVQTSRNRTLLDLALEAGFGSYSQCHRMVRALTGTSPSRMRGH